MPPEDHQSASALEARLWQRVREALSGQEPIQFLGARHDFEPFLALFQAVDLRDGSMSRMKDGTLYLNDLAAMVRMHAQHRTSHVLITGLNENWGAFSTHVPRRTVDWGIWEEHLVESGCTPKAVRQYLDDPAVKAVVTPHHTVFWHPTILSLPVGVSTTFSTTYRERPFSERARETKTQDLLISNSGWGHRQAVNDRVIANFNGRISNRFGLEQSELFDSMARARFVLCPSGLGWDTSRIWETLTLGSIPIVEYSEGWHTVLDELPVLFVTNFDEIKPALLAGAYPEILSRCEQFDYGKLTKQWWVSRITDALKAAPRGDELAHKFRSRPAAFPQSAMLRSLPGP